MGFSMASEPGTGQGQEPSDASLSVSPIGVYHGAAQQPAALPRQASLPGGSPGTIVLRGGLNLEQALHDLSGISHVWVLFWFHGTENWRPKVQPPRGEGRRGLFATRSPHRPNPIGMSVVELHSVSGRTLEIGDNDLIDGTPILDIKPYVPYCDSVPEKLA